MAGPIQWYDASLVLLTAGPVISAVPGTPSAVTTLHVINNKGGTGSPTYLNLHVAALYRVAVGSGSPPASSQPFSESAYPWAQARALQARIVSGYNQTVQATDWVSLGAGARLPIPALANDTGVKLEVRINYPFGSFVGLDPESEIALKVVESFAEEAGAGLSRSRPDGVYVGVRDQGFTALASTGDVIQNPAGASKDVEVQTTAWLALGISYRVYKALVAIPDASAAKERYDLISCGTTGTIVRTAGVEATPPLSDANKPAIPAGHIGLAWVRKRDTQNVVTTDITNFWKDNLALFLVIAGTGLNVQVSRGPRAVVDDSDIRVDGLTVVPVTASTTQYVWLLRTGRFAVTATEAAQAQRALLLAEVVTGASSVTTIRDRRHFIGFERLELEFNWIGSLVAGAKRGAVLGNVRRAYLLPLPGMVTASLLTNNGSSGNTIFDLEADDGAGGAFTTLFTGGNDRPTIPFSAADERDLDSSPVVLAIPANARLRATTPTIPAGTPPEDASLRVILAT